MTITHRILLLTTLPLATSCKATGNSTAIAFGAGQQPEATVTEQAPKPKQDAKKAKDSKEDEAKKREAKVKELRSKQRELAHADIEGKITKLDRRIEDMTLAASLREAAQKLEAAKAAYKLFTDEQRPRELEEHHINLDQRTHRADHAKDEFDELTAMYDADEFAKATKELVLKRGRRSLEIATRELAVAKKRDVEFSKHTLPRREKKLRQELVESELAVAKAQIAAQKAGLKAQLEDVRTAEKLSDLREDIAKLTAELAKEKK